MNRLSPRFVGCSTSLILGLVMLMGGCGPQDINDPDYLMQLKSSGVADALESGGPQGAAPQAGAPQAGAPDDSQAQGQPQGQPSDGQAMGGQPPAGAGGPQGGPVGGPVVAVAPVIASAGPTVIVPVPDIYEYFPPINTVSAETRLFGRLLSTCGRIIRIRPSHHDHTIINNTNVHHQYFTTIENRPVHTSRTCPVFNTTMTQEVMPPVEVTLPVVASEIPCVGPVCPPPPPPPCVGCVPLYTRGILPSNR